MEPDHAATIGELVLRHPEVTIVCNAKTRTMMQNFFTFDLDSRVQLVKEMDTLTTGRHTFAFVMAPMVHWPEVMVSYEPCYSMMNEWWKQLYGESEGKDGKGLFPASVVFSTDLHSMGQYIQDGRRSLFETVMLFEKPKREVVIGNDPANVDGLNFLEGKSMAYINRKAFEGTVLAHNDGGVPNVVISAPDFSEDTLGQIIYFFEKACAISGYLLGVNPFNQPGVESYKKNMFALLGKPGYEGEKEALEARLSK